MKFDIFDWLAVIFVILGALNWGFTGLFNFDLVAALFGGSMSIPSKIIYSLVGLAGAYLIYLMLRLKKS